MIPLNNPDIGENEKRHVLRALEEGWLSTSGPEVNTFEKKLSEFTHSPFVVALNSGTSALHLTLRALGVGLGDNVLIPGLSYVATQNAVMQCGASPVLVDVNASDGQMDANLLEQFLKQDCIQKNNILVHPSSGKRIAAVVPLWAWGDACEIEKIQEICKRYSILLVEDAAAGFGSFFKGGHAGTFGKAGILSFNGNKIITTGGGGAVLTADETLARRIRHLSLQAKVPDVPYLHDEMGFNDRMINLAAATGLGQLERFPEIRQKKNHIHQFYLNSLSGIGDLNVFPSHTSKDQQPNNWVFRIQTERAGDLYAHLRSKAIEAGHVWLPLNRLPMNHELSFISAEDNAWRLHQTVLALPSSTNLKESQLQFVSDSVREFFRK